MIGRRSFDRPGRSICVDVGRPAAGDRAPAASASAVTAPLVSFIAAQISPIALLVPDEPSASCQPSARYVPANCWNSAATSVSASFQRLLATACRRGRSAACWRRSPPAGFRVRSPRSPRPMMHSVEPPPMSITRRSSPGLRRLRMGDAEVDQARFLAAGDDFDRMARARFPPASGTPAASRSWRTVLVAIARTRCGGMSRRRWPKRARHSQRALARRRGRGRPCASRPSARRTVSRRRSTTRSWPST